VVLAHLGGDADLLDDPVALLTPDDVLHARAHMLDAGRDEKVGGFCADRLVLHDRKLHWLRAVLVSALAYPFGEGRIHPFLVLFYPLVVVPEQDLVSRGANRIPVIARLHALSLASPFLKVERSYWEKHSVDQSCLAIGRAHEAVSKLVTGRQATATTMQFGGGFGDTMTGNNQS